MDHPDIMSQCCDTSYLNAFTAERDYSNAVRDAVKLHCRDEYIPEDIARFCRTLATNLNRNLAAKKGEPLPDLHHLEDYTKCASQLPCTPESISSNTGPATEAGMGYPAIMT